MLTYDWTKNGGRSPQEPKRFAKDIPGAKIQFLDAGHFALETNVVEISAAMKDFFEKNGIARQSGKGGVTR
ncbi:MAG TPA: hypothetical protein VHX49_05375 [Candidatus Acidoferrales bacterium]|jgi:hypothetical protein|nr:hypothetical protein [Candidatus Acidoferrales bacterium]